MPSPTQITNTQLSRLIGTPDAPVIVDVRIDEDFEENPRLIPGSVRHPFDRMSELADRLKDQKVVVSCHRGKKLSEGAAAMLRTTGVRAESLQDGHVGWHVAGLPMIPSTRIPVSESGSGSLWVTRHRPKIDRIACPWLIRRFVDAKARFLFVSPAEVLAVAEKFDATPFDVGDVFWSHRGDQCTFDTMLDEFALQTETLTHLATLIRGADTNNLDLTPQSAGLLAVSLGLSRMYRDDNEQLEASMVVYDALYRWCRDAVGETHDW
ncbi:MAG: rhodanese-related sulfurtransferase [Gammaproteobacteria bacterium]|jgi:rhodanese-related sulfurtransferase